MNIYIWFLVILVSFLAGLLGPLWWMKDSPPEQPDPESLPVELPRAGYLPGPPFAGAQDPAYQAPIPWDLAGAAYALGQMRADQDAVSRQVDEIMLEVELHPERWRR